ncbi:MAG: flagellar biosynthesis protein FlhF [Halioglobus sp.]|jgi:flagellar biosynthesis protein FlhF
MKIKRYADKDSRSAMARIRTEMGPDAVILSNKNVDGQVELVAAMDFDEADIGPDFSSGTAGEFMLLDSQPDNPTLIDLQRELGNLRSMLEGKLSHLSWRDSVTRPSTKTAVHNRLVGLGLSRALAGQIVDKLGDTGELEQHWAKALEILGRRIPLMAGDSLLNHGGIVALVGSTGVGKTTTIAKLAARFVLRHGNQQVGLVTTDCYRIGGQEQLEVFANYLGVPMIVATDAAELRSAFDKLSSKKLILVDTAGMSQRDVRLYEQFSSLNSVGYDIDTYVVLSATAQQRALQEVVQVFGRALTGAMISKVDESAELGGVLDVVIRNQLKVGYVSAGQKVPEDLIPARAEYLVGKTVELVEREVKNSAQRIRSGKLANSNAV